MTSIGIAVVEWSGRFLVGVRGDDGPLPGDAEFPGGKCHPGESPRDAACRECAEETGLIVRPIRLLHNQTWTYPHGTVDLNFWLCRPADPQAVTGSHHRFDWHSAAELRTMRFPAANRTVIDLLSATTRSIRHRQGDSAP